MLALVGCQAPEDNLPREAMSGTVTFNGKSLAKGSIQFIPSLAGAGVSSGAIISNGSFAVPRESGLVPGSYKVMIFAEGESKTSSADGPPQRIPRDKKAAKGEGLIPLEYNMKTKLTAEIKSGGPNAFEFDLVK